MKTTYKGYELEIFPCGRPLPDKYPEDVLQGSHIEIQVRKDGIHVATVTSEGYVKYPSGPTVTHMASPFTNLQAALL